MTAVDENVLPDVLPDVAHAAAVMAGAERAAEDRMTEFAGHPGIGVPATGTSAADAMGRWGGEAA